MDGPEWRGWGNRVKKVKELAKEHICKPQNVDSVVRAKGGGGRGRWRRAKGEKIGDLCNSINIKFLIKKKKKAHAL